MPKTLSELTRDAAELSTVEQLKLARILLELAENNRLPQGGGGRGMGDGN